jgi:hypothetical protein
MLQRAHGTIAAHARIEAIQAKAQNPAFSRTHT